MTERFREILAEEYQRAGWIGAAEDWRNPDITAVYNAPIRQPILEAMRRIYLQGRDDANADADAAENESIEQMEDDVSPSNPG